MPPETDPIDIENKPVLTDPQNWASRSHEELYAAVHNNNDPGQAGEIGSHWAKYGTELTEAAQAMAKIITDSESKWTGDAADGARAAMKKLSNWVNDTAAAAVDLGDKVAEQGRVMEGARAQMPQPVQFDWGRAVAALALPGTPAFVMAAMDIAVANAASRAAHEQAVNVMTSMENSSRQIDSSMPVFKPPFNPVTGEVEKPVMATRMAAGAPTLDIAEALMSTHAQGAGTATAPTPAGAGTADTPGTSAYTPAAASMPTGGPGGGAGGGSWATPPAPIRPDITAAAGATYTPPAPYTPQFPSGGGGGTYTSGSDYKPQFPSGGTPYPGTGPIGGPAPTPRPNANVPKPAIPPGLTRPDTYLPKDTNLPKGMPPGMTGGPGGGGGGAAAAAAAAMKGGAGGFGGGGFGGGGGGAFGAGAAGGAAGGGAMQSGGAAGVAQGGRGAMPVGMTPPGAAAAAGVGMGPGAMGAGAGAAGGRGQEDKERKSANYIMGGDLFEVPGENLPPSVIGGTKPKKQKGPEQS